MRSNTAKYIGTKIGHFTPHTHKIAKLSDFYSKNVKLDDFYPPLHTHLYSLCHVYFHIITKNVKLDDFSMKIVKLSDFTQHWIY